MSLPFNYHHLRYFRAVAREGGLRPAAEKLHVSPPSISAQIKELEASFGEKLFQKKGRSNVLTESGQIALRYADEIFSLGEELANAIQRRPTSKKMRLHVGVADALPKLVTNEILRPIFEEEQSIHVICREGKVEDLLAQLTTHRLDIVLADEPASSSHGKRIFNHKLGESPITICAEQNLAKRLKRGFPKSLHGAPALLPAESTALRRALDNWFREIGVRPQVVADFEDAALMKVVATDGKGFIALPTIVASEGLERYDLRAIGKTDRCTDQFFAITTERRITHPAVNLITDKARELFGD